MKPTTLSLENYLRRNVVLHFNIYIYIYIFKKKTIIDCKRVTHSSLVPYM